MIPLHSSPAPENQVPSDKRNPNSSQRRAERSGTIQVITPHELQALGHQLSAVIERLEHLLLPIGKLSTVAQAAKCLGISPRTIRTQLYLGEWPGYRVGRAVRVDPEELRRLMNKAFVP